MRPRDYPAGRGDLPGRRAARAFTEGLLRRLAAALSSERGEGRPSPSFFFDLRPYEYQRAILEKLRVAREEHGRWKNLVVAATGTGKTMIAAFDYAAQVKDGVRPRLLFVAHREEILAQALHTFRNVLHDHNFGELLKGGATPTSCEHLFATIQSLSRRDLPEALGSEFWHTVVVDEFGLDRVSWTPDERRLRCPTCPRGRRGGSGVASPRKHKRECK